MQENHYAQIAQNIRLKALACGRDPEEVQLIAVTKAHSVESMQSIYHEGCRKFGESRIQETLEKLSEIPKDSQWHFIGSLQRNKVSKAIGLFHLIHSVDTPQIAEKISQVSVRKGVETSILLQVNTSGEANKHGLAPKDWELHLDFINQLPNINVNGLMTMASYTDDEQLIRSCFRQLYQLRERWRPSMREPTLFEHLSMGMSHDYLIAIEEGATLLRIGSAIFGSYESLDSSNSR